MKKVLEGERRWTTVLFTDMVGFSGVSEKLGAERVYQLLSEVIALATDAIEAHGGHMVDFAGDSIQAVFGAPIALENASLMACSAALDFISSLNAHSAQFELEYGIRPQFRIGIAGGTIILGQLGLNEKLDVTVMGEAVNEAARLEGIAGPGSVLISSAVFGQVEGYVEAADLGEKELKGFARKTRVYELNAVLGNVSRFEGLKRRGLTKLVGREHELAELIQAVETPAPEAQFVTVRAQAGIGKSRLVHEFTNRISDKTPVLMGQCNPSTSQVAFGPFIDLLRRMVGVSKDEEPKAVATKLHAALAKKHDYDKLLRLLSGGSAAADVNGQNDLHGDALRMRKLMEEIMIDLASDLKHVLIIEDAHWIDSTSNELLSQLAARTDVDRMLFILTTRPGYSPSWQGSQNAREIVVKPLGRESIWELAAKQLENANYAPELIDIVISKSEGNPLFAEEIIRYLKSSNRLIETPNGMSLPETEKSRLLSGNLEHLVMSRVDTLPNSEKKFLQVSAAIGRLFATNIARAVLDDSEDLTERLDNCRAEGLIEPDPDGLDTEWRFTHALIRDAIYGSLLADQLAVVHSDIADALEARIGNRQQEMAESLAYHFEKARKPEKAVAYLIMAAGKSQRLYAFDQTDTQLVRALEIIEINPECVTDHVYGNMVTTWFRSLEQAGNFGGLIDLSKRVLPRLQAAGYSTELALATTLLAISFTHAREYEQSLKLATETLDAANVQNDELSAAWAKVALMRIYEETAWEGRETIERLAEEIRPVAENYNDNHIAMMALYLLSAHYRSAGEMLKARNVADQIREFAEKHDDRRALSYWCWSVGIIYLLEDNPAEALKTAEKGLELALPNSADANVNWAVWIHVQSMFGNPHAAREKLTELLEISRKFEDYNVYHSMIYTQAILEIKSGKVRKGWNRFQTLFPQVEAAGNVQIWRHIHLIRAELLMVISGLIKPPPVKLNEKQSTVKPKPGILDILILLKLRWNALKLAKSDFQFFCERVPFRRGALFARAQVSLGAIALARKDKTAAREHLTLGKQLAEDEQLKHISDRADRYLEKLRVALSGETR